MSYDGKGRFDFIDLKQAVLDVSVKKAQAIDSAKDWSLVQWELRKRLLKSMSEGDVLVLQMSTACPPLTRFRLLHPYTCGGVSSHLVPSRERWQLLSTRPAGTQTTPCRASARA